jgi:outer membrane assembly lipoprotein YfgL
LLHGAWVLVLASVLGACSSGAPRKPDPAPLPPNPNLLGVRQAWHLDLGEVDFPLTLHAVGHMVGVAGSDGTVSLIDARTGEAMWRVQVGASLSAGVGHDGREAAVVTSENELVAVQDGQVIWRQRLPAPAYTAPLVAGARVFVLSADRTVSAYDGRSGRRLWSQPRTGEALVLREPGVLMAVGDTLVLGQSGRLVGMNPLNGGARWEVAIATPRGTNDVERLVDLVAGVARQGSVVCARAFQAAIGCVDAGRGSLLWSKPAAGASGLSGDGDLVLGVEFDGTLVAWRHSDGERVWATNQLRFRGLTAPVLMGSMVVVGDRDGRLHFLARADGTLKTRFEVERDSGAVHAPYENGDVPFDPALHGRFDADRPAFAATPVLAGNTLVVVTRAGRALGLRAE